MTSRLVPRTEKVLRKSSVLQITLAQHLFNKDFTVYIEHRLANMGLLTETRKEAQQSLMSKSQGLFPYTKLIIDDILGSQGFAEPASLLTALDKLPTGLADISTGMLYDHSVRLGVTQSLQLTIFQWVTHSSRPLRLLEISTKVDSSPKQHSFNINASSLRGSRNTKSVIRGKCGPLIEILADDTVSIIHHSFTEHLISPEKI